MPYKNPEDKLKNQQKYREQQRDWIKQKNVRYYQEVIKPRSQSIRERLREIKTSRGCKYCGETHPATLDFHHIDPSQKVDSVSRMVSTYATEKDILTEAAKCDVVCANCHRKLHWDGE